jgi:V/A-type H+-transporting ATPase subunit E
MENKLQELTNKIYAEGVEEGKAKAQELIKEAEAGSAEILSKAKEEAVKIISEAKNQAEELKNKTDSEIILSGKQAISALKQQIQEMITAKALDKDISSSLEDPKNITELILAAVKNWKSHSGENPRLELLLPESQRKKLDSLVKSKIQKTLSKGLTIEFSKSIKGGFQIGPEKESYKISLTDEDFREFFRQYLRPKTRAFLFND